MKAWTSTVFSNMKRKTIVLLQTMSNRQLFHQKLIPTIGVFTGVTLL